MSIYLQFEIFLKNQKGVVKYDYRDVEGAVPYNYREKYRIYRLFQPIVKNGSKKI